MESQTLSEVFELSSKVLKCVGWSKQSMCFICILFANCTLPICFCPELWSWQSPFPWNQNSLWQYLTMICLDLMIWLGRPRLTWRIDSTASTGPTVEWLLSTTCRYWCDTLGPWDVFFSPAIWVGNSAPPVSQDGACTHSILWACTPQIHYKWHG